MDTQIHGNKEKQSSKKRFSIIPYKLVIRKELVNN